MTLIVIVTADTAFPKRLRRSLDANVEVRAVWSDEWAGDGLDDAVRSLCREPADVIALGPGLPTDHLVTLAAELDRDRPDLTLVAIEHPTVELMQKALRAGARDVMAPDAVETEMREVFDRALDATTRRREMPADGPPSRNQIISILSPKGGSGKTTVATNLAVGLADREAQDTLLVDLDLQFGDSATALGIVPDYTIVDAAKGGHLDSATLKSFLVPHHSGALLLAAPESLAQAEDVDPDWLKQAMAVLTDEFRYVVIDTAAGIDERALLSMEFATDLLFVASTDVPSVRGLRRQLDALDAISLNGPARHFLLNRANARTGLSKSDIEDTVGMRAEFAIPESRAVTTGTNTGQPVVEGNPREPAGRALLDLVNTFKPTTKSAPADTPVSWFSRRKDVA